MEKTIVDIFLESTDKFKNNVALQMVSEKKEEAIFYFQLHDNVNKVIAHLISRGIRKGERIAIISENRPQWALAYFAILGTGAVVVGIDINLKPQEISFILNDAEVKTAFVSSSFLSQILELKKETGLKEIICFDETELKDVYTLSDILKNKVTSLQYPQISPRDLAMLVYTSGTTGKSKAVMLSHGNITSNITMIHQVFKWSAKDNLLSLLPLSHMFELTCGLLAPLSSGARITYLDKLTPANMVKVMQKTQVTSVLVVPAIVKVLRMEIMKGVSRFSKKKKFIFYSSFWLCAFFRIFNFNPGRIIFSKVHRQFGGRLKYFVSGGAPLSAYLAWWFDCLGITILQGYGLTEASPVVSVNTLMENRLGSVGKPLPGLEAKIKDGLEEGELLVKGENVMSGYYKNPEETSRVIRDGWLHTGDLGKIDSHGFIFILGRDKNVIVQQSGLKVYPEEIEEELAKSPAIQEACVLGRKERGSLEETAYALVVPNEEYLGMKLSENNEKIQEIMAKEIKEVNMRLATYKHIHGFELRPELPKTATRKVKKELVKKTLSGQPI